MKRRILIRIISLCLLVFCCSLIKAQDEQLHFEHYNYQHGLSSPQISAIYQDQLGFMWIGTAYGLNRFDGINFKYWTHRISDSNSLVQNIVLAIAEDKHKNLWIGTQEGISCFNPFTEHFTNYYSGGKGVRHFTKKYCWTFVDAADNIWIGHDEGIAVLNADRNKITDIKIELQPQGRNNFVSEFVEDNNFVYAATSHGLYRIDKNNYSTRRFTFNTKNEDINDALSSLKKDEKGRLWCGTWYLGIGLFCPGDTLIRNLGNIPGTAYPAEENGETFLYISHFGLRKINANRFIEHPEVLATKLLYVHSDNDPQSLSDNSFEGLYIDRAKNLWGHTKKGLEKCNTKGNKFKVFSYDHLVSSKYAPYSICSANEANRYWVLTGQNIFLFDRKAGTYEKHKFNIEQYSPMSMIRTSTGYWIASLHGLIEMDLKMNLIHVYNRNTVKNLSVDHFRKVIEGNDGSLYLACYRNGIAKFDPVKKQFTEQFDNDLDKLRIQKKDAEDIYIDSNGYLWLAMQGLYRYNPMNGKVDSFLFCKNESVTSECNSPLSFCYSSNRRLYIGTRKGLHYYDFDDKTMHNISFPAPADNLITSIFSVTEDEKHRLWMGTRNGLLMYDQSKRYVTLYTQNDGLPDNSVSFGAQWSDKELFIGMDNLIIAFTPSEIQEKVVTPVPVFASVAVDNEKIDWRSLFISVKYDKTVSFDFVSLNYSNPAQNTYVYQLNEDGPLLKIGNNHTLRFSNLKAGNYTLKIKAAGNDGVQNETPLVFRFKVLPPVWGTWWFTCLVAVAISGSVYALYRYRLNQILQMERLRSRIAADLHDDVGATLSSISMYSNTVKNQVKEKMPHLEVILDKMGESSRSMVSNMSDIIWALNPDNDEGKNLSERIEMYAKETCSVHDIYLQFKCADAINEYSFTPEERKNIYLIFKESLNNSLKYAKATSIEILLEVNDRKLLMKIRDNGIGFSPGQNLHGNGLKNIHRRANEIHGTIDIISDIGEGTTIILECKIT